jgi:tetratricopeptide (TPR) repeat protein
MTRFVLCAAALLAWSCGPDQTEVDRLVEQGRTLYLEGEYDAAIDSLRQAAVLDDDDVVAYLYLSRAYLRLSRHDEAMRAIEQAIRLDPNRPSLYEILGNIHTSRYTAFAYTETQQADGQAAISAFRKAIFLDGGHAAAHYNLGIMYGYLDSTKLAERAFNAALEADSTLGAAHKKLGIMRRESGQLPAAVSFLENAARLAPDDAQAHYQLGLARRDGGEFEKAASSLERAAALNPISPKIGFSLGNVYGRLGRIDDSRRVLAGAERRRARLSGLHSEVSPPNSGALPIGSPIDHYNMALVHASDGRMDAAALELRRTVQIDPNRVDALMGLGRLYLEAGNADSALPYMKRAVALNEGNPVSHMRLGWTYRELGRYHESRQAFREAARVEPKLPEAHLNHGQIAFAMGDIEESVDHFLRAIELRPDYAVAHLSLGVAQVHLGRLDEAATAYERVVELDPDDGQAHLFLSDVYTRLGRLEEARHHRELAPGTSTGTTN